MKITISYKKRGKRVKRIEIPILDLTTISQARLFWEFEQAISQMLYDGSDEFRIDLSNEQYGPRAK